MVRARFCCKSSLREPLQAWPGPNKAQSQAKDSKELGANRKLGAHPAPQLTRSEAGWEQAGCRVALRATRINQARSRWPGQFGWDGSFEAQIRVSFSPLQRRSQAQAQSSSPAHRPRR